MRLLALVLVAIAPALLAATIFTAPAAAAEPGAAAPTSPAATAAPTTAGAAIAALRELAPVAVPQPSALALQYHRSGDWLWAISHAWAVLVLALWLFTGASVGLRSLAEKMGRNWLIAVVLYTALFVLITGLVNLPLEYYLGFARQHAYGLSRQSFGAWLGDEAKSLGIGALLTSLVLWVPYFLIRRSPRRWWLYTGLLGLPFLFITMLAKPVWYDPLFNDFGAMHDQALEQKIVALAERAGIADSRVFEVDKSKDTRAINAYVTGVWGSKRIVLWDTLIAKLNERELLVVMGHEMGHYVLGHVVRSILLLSLGNLLALYLAHRAVGWLIARYPRRLGFDRMADVASLPLFLLVFQVLALAGTPIGCAYSRHQEHEADRFALEITQDNHAGGTAFVKLMHDNLSVPQPCWLYTCWRATHPSITERIAFCNAYRPWSRGLPSRYAGLFKSDDTHGRRAKPRALPPSPSGRGPG